MSTFYYRLQIICDHMRGCIQLLRCLWHLRILLLHTRKHTTPNEHTVYLSRHHQTNSIPHHTSLWSPLSTKWTIQSRLCAKENKPEIKEECMLECCFFTNTKLCIRRHKSQHLGRRQFSSRQQACQGHKHGCIFYNEWIRYCNQCPSSTPKVTKINTQRAIVIFPRHIF